MPSFNISLGLILLATAYPLLTNGSLIASSKHATHRSRVVTRDLQLETFHPPTTFQTFGDGVDQPQSFGPTTLEGMAVSIVQSQIGVDSTNVHFQSGFSDGPGAFAYVRQSHEGVPFANAVANVALNNNKIVSFGSSFVETTNIAASTPSLDVQSVIPNAEKALDGKFNGHTPTLRYLVQSDGSIALTHVVQIQNDNTGTWFEAFMDAHTGELLSVTDFVAEASYKVLPIAEEIFPDGLAILVNPQDAVSSPLGWHNDGTTNTTITAGNNVVSFKGTQTSTSHTIDPTAGQNIDASQASFNFQTNNFGKGGLGNDRVLMSVQDASGTNNANFATPPDGQSGTCRMFLWTETPVHRDGAMENDIITHEQTHGITNRMTGGGTGTCLQTTEAGGMGEGWSDAMAEYPIPPGSSLPDYVLGQYVTNSAAGIRTHPYSISNITNPLRYSSIATLNEVHNIGEVWANMLHNVYAALVAAHGFSVNAKTDPTTSEGNVVFLHLFIDALPIQPCNPTFVNARDAWIQADQNRYAGVNRCLLWRAFASRGLGVNAANFVDDSSVPSGC
ncbi:Fungalysin metallopeptidase-domain-containing protein [Infundibulicybe gibba]|nr:Fungalysin metallopeptidase-domain-containing protein [Infundibulicybe gibba]